MQSQEGVGKGFVEADRIIFKEVNDEELNIINQVKSDITIHKYFKKMYISAIVLIIVFSFHGAGKLLKYNTVKGVLNNPKLIANTAMVYLPFMLGAFIAFNCITLFYAFVKRQLVSLTENYYIIYDGIVEDKYDGKKVAVEGKNRRKKYVVFSCDQGICSKSITVDNKRFKNTAVGENIVVLKSVTVNDYTFKYLKVDEFNSVRDKISKKS